MSKEINDGGAAFARPYSKDEWQEEHIYGQEGMSLRDYFAAKAMQGMVTGKGSISYQSTANNAYEIADVMLAARVVK